ncbi:hypothetical protein CVT25_004822 [Psilocybe cyanescens]|uniref:Uncharacterized protein n=1 Tax=Psilocybe cyanescens TaxID=93625 RepID=A0A409VY27_PSICY|nr:hypothetical protein CVT25_004822 [Psilocybe cyanescens]
MLARSPLPRACNLATPNEGDGDGDGGGGGDMLIMARNHSQSTVQSLQRFRGTSLSIKVRYVAQSQRHYPGPRIIAHSALAHLAPMPLSSLSFSTPGWAFAAEITTQKTEARGGKE